MLKSACNIRKSSGAFILSYVPRNLETRVYGEKVFKTPSLVACETFYINNVKT